MLLPGAPSGLGVRPVQDGFVGLAGERAFFYLRIGDAEETAAASVERELVLAEILHVIRRELTGGVQANLIQHPPEIDQPSDFVVATAQAWNVLHKRNMNRKQVTRHFPANAFSSFARSSFFICHTSCVTRCSPTGSFTHSAKNFAGTTCQKSPYLSATQPHSSSFPPSAVSFSQ